MADCRRAKTDATADVRRDRIPGPSAGAGTRYRTAWRPGRVQAGAQASRLSIRGRGGRRCGHAGRDAGAREMVAARWPVVGRQPRTADRNDDGRRRSGPYTGHVRVTGRRQARTARVLGRRQERPDRGPAAAKAFAVGGRGWSTTGQSR